MEGVGVGGSFSIALRVEGWWQNLLQLSSAQDRVTPTLDKSPLHLRDTEKDQQPSSLALIAIKPMTLFSRGNNAHRCNTVLPITAHVKEEQ